MVCKLEDLRSVYELSALWIRASSKVGCLDLCMCCVLSQFIESSVVFCWTAATTPRHSEVLAYESDTE